MMKPVAGEDHQPSLTWDGIFWTRVVAPLLDLLNPQKVLLFSEAAEEIDFWVKRYS